MKLHDIIVYKNWADEVYLQFCEQLTEDQQKREFQEYQNSIYKVLQHIYEAQYYWLERIGMEVEPENWESLHTSSILSGIRKLNSKLLNFVETRALNTTEILHWEEGDKPVSTTYENIIFNLVTHNAYHRGQLAIFLRMLGWKSIQETDFTPYYYEINQH